MNATVSNNPAVLASPPEEKMSKRDALRAKLRAQEERLSSFVRNSSSEGAKTYLAQMDQVKGDLAKVEQERTALEEELDRLRNATDGDSFLKEKMEGIQEGFEKQVKKIQSLEDELFEKDNEIETLRNELSIKLRRIVELEFDLETHDVHYTSYAADHYKLGEEALKELRNESMAVKNGDASVASDASMGLKPKKAQKLITKLLNDLDNLEARYKEEKLSSSAGVSDLLRKNTELETKINILRKKIGETEGGELAEKPSQNSIDQQSVTYLRRRVDTLEARRAILQKEVDRLTQVLKETRVDAETDAKRSKHVADNLKIENEALKARIEELEQKKRMFRKNKNGGEEKFQEVQSSIQDQFATIHRLEASNEIKDRQIATMKKEIASLRTREIAFGNRDKKYSKLDSDLLKGPQLILPTNDEDETGNGEGSNYISELQRALHNAQQSLVKKDQELVIERAKAASTAAGLLARITELSGKKYEMKGSKKDIRFNM